MDQIAEFGTEKLERALLLSVFVCARTANVGFLLVL
jgi:hypothetical protein